MATPDTKIPVEPPKDDKRPTPLESLRRQVDRLFEDFDLRHFPFSRSLDVEPFWRRELTISGMPAVDIVEKADAYELSAELPGMDEQHIEIRLSNGVLTIKGEKKDEREERKKDYYLSERHYGSFQRSFSLPEGVDPEKIEARFARGVLTLTLPKRPEAQHPERTIPIRS